MFYSWRDEFNHTNGFNFAVAFSAYDDDPEPILDPTYGELKFNHYFWGRNEEGLNEAGR